MRSGGVPSPVLEGEHKCKESPAGIGQPLVTAGEKQDLVFSKRCTEERQHIGDAWEEKERRTLRNEGSLLTPHRRPLNPTRAGSHSPSPHSAPFWEEFSILPKSHFWVTQVRAPPRRPLF